ncbi:MAG: sugar phosphate isomerase/epimerase [Lentisphaerae bacterium]|nr:sugar phosphate isomerase/epimerase [Lentisphaerota bacterium]
MIKGKREVEMVKLGVCGPIAMAETIKAAGFDYFEGGVSEVLCPLESDALFTERLAALQRLSIPCQALNGMVPGALKIVGPEVDTAALEHYVAVMTRRAAQAGIAVIVFGSGDARRIPDGFDREKAGDQLFWFMRLLGYYAAIAGVVIALEPLNKGETNIFNTAGEGGEWVKRVDRPGFRLLVDAYHLMREEEPAEIITNETPLIAHMHVATKMGRFAPGLEQCPELDSFYAAVKASGYSGRLSIEGNAGDNPALNLKNACALLRNALS